MRDEIPDISVEQDEADRLSALRAYGVLHTAPQPEFDDAVLVAAQVCGTPTALISFVTEDQQWFKARVGLDADSTPREQSFCAHAMGGAKVMVVPDAALDRRFADNPLVTGEPHIRFYAGAPLVSPDGHPLGSLCVIDSVPRPDGLDERQTLALEALARQVMSQMELHRLLGWRADVIDETGRKLAAHEAEHLRRDARDSELVETSRLLAQSEARFQAIADSMPQMVWSTLPDGFHDYYNTNSPASPRARPTARAGTGCSTPTTRSAPGRAGSIR